MSSILNLYKTCEEASFIERKNRFSLLLRKGRKIIEAYLSNTGRMEEFLVEGKSFFVTPTQTPKFQWQVVSSCYQGNYVLLDTRKSTHIIRLLIDRNIILDSVKWVEIGAEPNIGGRRFDIILKLRNSPSYLIKVKTCTLCHKGVALFPDAPSRRASQDIELLGRLKKDGYEPFMIFLIPNGSAHTFIPNFHTDLGFSRKLLTEPNVTFKAFSINLTDPMSIDLDSIKEVAIGYEQALAHTRRKGSYILLMYNDKNIEIDVGKLGRLRFEKGYYVYIGSAMGGVDGRVKRHLKKDKKRFWHIDYLTPDYMSIDKVYTIRRSQRIEELIAERVERISCGRVGGFGASDSSAPSHLFFFSSPPHRMSAFIDIVLDLKTFSDTNKADFH